MEDWELEHCRVCRHNTGSGKNRKLLEILWDKDFEECPVCLKNKLIRILSGYIENADEFLAENESKAASEELMQAKIEIAKYKKTMGFDNFDES